MMMVIVVMSVHLEAMIVPMMAGIMIVMEPVMQVTMMMIMMVH